MECQDITRKLQINKNQFIGEVEYDNNIFN